MFFEEIQALKRHIENKCQVLVILGDVDTGPNQLPVVRILHNQKGQITRYQEYGLSANLPVRLEVISDRKEESKAWKVMENIFLNANSFNAEKGHTLEEDFQPAYDDNTFTIALGYNLKLRFVNTQS